MTFAIKGEKTSSTKIADIGIQNSSSTLMYRFFTIIGHLIGLIFCTFTYNVEKKQYNPSQHNFGYSCKQFLALLIRPFLNPALTKVSFARQLKLRLEMLGPTYIKLGQSLSLRKDILPESVTEELRTLLDKLDFAPFNAVKKIIISDLKKPIEELFLWIDHKPLGSASIAQTHRAITLNKELVILKIVKPGIKETLLSDAKLLKFIGTILQFIIPEYQPKQVIDEFFYFTLRELEMTLEADNAESFAMNFKAHEDVVFPKIFRQYSGKNVLCMEYLEGIRPDSPEITRLSYDDRKYLLDLGAEVTIQMLCHDGFIHADLHPGNLLILPGSKLGIIDLGMVGFLNQKLRRYLLYYYYSLLIEDYENASKYLAAIARPSKDAQISDFCREAENMGRKWRHSATFEDFSLAQLILESLRKGAEYKMYFPVEMLMMAKALVTFEGVGYLLDSEFNMADVSQKHIFKTVRKQFSPHSMAREGLRLAPDILEAIIKFPMLVSEGLHSLEQQSKQEPEHPFSGLRGTLLGGFSLVAGAILASFNGPWPIWVILLTIGFILPFRRGN